MNMKFSALQPATLSLIVTGIGLVVVLSGCASNWPKFILLESSRPSQLNEFLQYFHDAKSLDPTELHQLYIEEEEILFYQDDQDSVVRLALLSLLQESKLKTTPRSIDLLKTYLYENNSEETVHHFVSFLHYVLSQAQYHDTLYEEAKGKLNTALKERDQQAALYERTKLQLDHSGLEKRKQQAQYKKTNRALHREKQEVENLRKQIEQLKTIEKTINKRKQTDSPST